MKQIIKGKRYDTETAKLVAEYSNDLDLGDFSNLEESLYQTQSGKWFIAGSGGALTKYATTCGGRSSSGESILPIEASEALRWLESHKMTEEIEAWFTIADA